MNLELGRPDFDDADRPHPVPARVSVQADDSQTAWPENNPGFRANEFVAYPAHGVGQISAIDVQTVAGDSLEYFVIYFAKSKMKIRVPTRKAASVGMRRLSDPATIEQVRRSLSQAAFRARANWPRLIKEYEAKIKSGDIIAIAEVMRDLYRRPTDSEQNHTERQLYATALDRVSGEVALIENVSEEKAVLGLESLLMSRSGKKV
jgi:CarD family transcriptional regulator, regulator of rRNA transcription